jgi:hypothetical protein
MIQKALLGVLAGCLAAGSVSVGWSAVPPASRPVLALRHALEAAQGLEEVKVAAGPLLPVLGATLHTGENINGPYVRLNFEPPIIARKLCSTMGWSRPQATWSGTDGLVYTIKLWRQGFVDFYRRARMRTAVPQVGRWALIANLVGPPSGSPANFDGYDLTRSEAQVRSLQVTAWKAEYDPQVLIEQQSKPQPDEVRLEVSTRLRTYSGPCPVDVQFVGKLRNAAYSSHWEMRWERSDGTWTDVERVTVEGPEQRIKNTWRLGAPHRRLVVSQKLRAWPINLESEPATVTIECK